MVNGKYIDKVSRRGNKLSIDADLEQFRIGCMGR